MSFISAILPCTLFTYRRFYQRLQQRHISQIVARLIDGRFRDERCVLGPRIVQQPPKRLDSDRSLTDMLVAIATRTSWVLGVIAVPHPNVLQSDGRIQPAHGFLPSVRGNDV